ncbi:ATP-binding protein [Chloroflexota bacterium]
MATGSSMDANEYIDICNNANDLIQSVTPEGHFRYVNTTWLKTLGYQSSEITDMTIFDVLHPDEIEHCQELFSKVMSGQDIGLITTRFMTRNGHIVFVEGNVNCHFIDGMPAYTRSIFRDITKSMQTERTIKRLYDKEKKLRVSLENEISRRSEFARVLVHELKTPLTSILGLAELLKESDQKPPYDRAINSMYRSSSELNERISELLELTRAEVGELKIHPRRINPSTMISEIIRDIEPVITSKNQRIRSEIPSKLSHIKADRKRLRQVLQNIINNAIKATLENGDIVIRAIQQEDYLIIKVQDTGQGISRKDQLRIFEPYFRIAGVAGGYESLGLGLTLSKRIVELHGGQIWVESDVGKGSTFSFSIPLLKA